MSGTYVGMSYDTLTAYALCEWAAAVGIPNVVQPNTVHTTIMYSQTTIDPVFYRGEELRSMNMTIRPSGFDIFDGSLVMLLDAPELVKMHEELISAGGTHDYPRYNPHVTISYDASVDPSSLSLPDIRLIPATIYTEPLDLEWR